MRLQPKHFICLTALMTFSAPLFAQKPLPLSSRPFVLANFNQLHAHQPGDYFYGKVSWVFDGDTVSVVDDNGESIRIREAGIDCPEKAQPYGSDAGKLTYKLLNGKRVRVQVVDIDTYKRVVGHIFLPDGRRLGKVLLGAGMAWWYRWFSQDSSLGDLEAAAKAEGLGLWADANPEPPWDYRRRTRTLEVFDDPLEGF